MVKKYEGPNNDKKVIFIWYIVKVKISCKLSINSKGKLIICTFMYVITYMYNTDVTACYLQIYNEHNRIGNLFFTTSRDNMSQERLFKSFEIIITFILLCFSLWLTRDVFNKYQENVTTYKESSIPNTGEDWGLILINKYNSNSWWN